LGLHQDNLGGGATIRKIEMVADDGKMREQTVITLETFLVWVGTISVNRVDEFYRDKPVCELFGLTREKQREKIASSEAEAGWATTLKTQVVAKDGKMRDQVLITLERFLMWPGRRRDLRRPEARVLTRNRLVWAARQAPKG
jgi:hypothetical protein